MNTNQSGEAMNTVDFVSREIIIRKDVMRNGQVSGIVLATRVGNEVYLGYSILNPSDRKFNEEISVDVATRRLFSGRYRIPAKPSASQLRNFFDGSGRLGRDGKFHPIRNILVSPMTQSISQASVGKKPRITSQK